MVRRLLICSLLFVSVVSLEVSPVYALSNQEIINSNNEKIEEKARQKEELNNQINSENLVLNDLKAKMDAQSAKVAELDKALEESNNAIANISSEIQTTLTDIGKKEKEITETTLAIATVQKDLDEKNEILGNRVRGMYKDNTVDNLIRILLDSTSFSDFCTNINIFTTVVKIDNQLIDDIKKAKELIEEKKEQLKLDQLELIAEKKHQDELKSDLEIENQKIVVTRNNQVAIYNDIQNLEQQKDNYIASLQNNKQSLEDQIDALQSDNSELRGIMSGVNTSRGTGAASIAGFIMPVPGGLTCPYGPRIHPITGKQSFHHGVDLSASMGTPVVAAKDGVVVKTEYNSIYGNMVIINHGGGYQTLYAHNSRFAVSVGTHVSQGQVIAYAGSTGWSTGPHCHFEIHYNGDAIRPY